MNPWIFVTMIAAGVAGLAYTATEKDTESNVKKPNENDTSGGSNGAGDQPGSDDKPVHGTGGVKPSKSKPKKGKSDVRMVNQKLATGADSGERNGATGELDPAAGNSSAEAVTEGDDDEPNNSQRGDDGGDDGSSDVPDEPTGGAERDGKKGD